MGPGMLLKAVSASTNAHKFGNALDIRDARISPVQVSCLQDVWWNTDVIILGEAGLKRDHEVASFLAKEGKCHSVYVFRDGIGAFEAAYPFLVGQSLNAHRGLVYPSPVAKHLYLGNWANAEDSEKLKHLGIRRVLTIHNDPQKLKLPGMPLTAGTSE